MIFKKSTTAEIAANIPKSRQATQATFGTVDKLGNECLRQFTWGVAVCDGQLTRVVGDARPPRTDARKRAAALWRCGAPGWCSGMRRSTHEGGTRPSTHNKGRWKASCGEVALPARREGVAACDGRLTSVVRNARPTTLECERVRGALGRPPLVRLPPGAPSRRPPNRPQAKPPRASGTSPASPHRARGAAQPRRRRPASQRGPQVTGASTSASATLVSARSPMLSRPAARRALQGTGEGEGAQREANSNVPHCLSRNGNMHV